VSSVDWERVASDAKAQTQRADELLQLADETVARADAKRAQLEQYVEEHAANP
jgi:hypothetical protein